MPDGNCFTSCLASILEVPLEAMRGFDMIFWRGARQVEAIADPWSKKVVWWRTWDRLQRYLCKHFYVSMAFDLEAPEGFSVACGVNPRGIGHCVVALDGAPIHDPNPKQTWLVEIDSYVWLEDEP